MTPSSPSAATARPTCSLSSLDRLARVAHLLRIELPPLPRDRAAEVRGAPSAVASLPRARTIPSTSARTCGSSSFASSGREEARHRPPIIAHRRRLRPYSRRPMTLGSRIRAGAVASRAGARRAARGRLRAARASRPARTVALYPVTVDDAGGPGAGVAAARSPQRVAVLDREGQRILRALGVTATLAADGEREPAHARLLERSQPGLVVAGPSNDSLQLRRLHERVPAPIYVVGGDSIAAVQRSILELGLLTDTAVRARQLAAAIAAAEEKGAARAGSGDAPDRLRRPRLPHDRRRALARRRPPARRRRDETSSARAPTRARSTPRARRTARPADLARELRRRNDARAAAQGSAC